MAETGYTADNPICGPVKVSTRGQVTIRDDVRKRLGIVDGVSEINIIDIVVVK